MRNGKSSHLNFSLAFFNGIMSDGPGEASIFIQEFSCNFSRLTYILHGLCEGLCFNCHLDLALKYLQSITNGDASFDNIPGIALCKLAPVIVYPVNISFQQSFAQFKFPTTWKHVLIQSICKQKGDRYDPKAYRSESLYCTLGNVLETLVKDQLDAHLNSVNYFSTKQPNFMFGQSMVSNLLETDALIADCCNNDTAFDIITFDFSRAFNKVPIIYYSRF